MVSRGWRELFIRVASQRWTDQDGQMQGSGSTTHGRQFTILFLINPGWWCHRDRGGVRRRVTRTTCLFCHTIDHSAAGYFRGRQMQVDCSDHKGATESFTGDQPYLRGAKFLPDFIYLRRVNTGASAHCASPPASRQESVRAFRSA